MECKNIGIQQKYLKIKVKTNLTKKKVSQANIKNVDLIIYFYLKISSLLK